YKRTRAFPMARWSRSWSSQKPKDWDNSPSVYARANNLPARPFLARGYLQTGNANLIRGRISGTHESGDIHLLFSDLQSLEVLFVAPRSCEMPKIEYLSLKRPSEPNVQLQVLRIAVKAPRGVGSLQFRSESPLVHH